MLQRWRNGRRRRATGRGAKRSSTGSRNCTCASPTSSKGRVATILKLEWATHFDAALTTITITDHKTSGTAGDQTVPVSAQLREILLDIRRTQTPETTHVITWRDAPVQSLKTGLRRAVQAIGLTWGMRDGVTFHVMRHSMSTILANPHLVGALTERLRADVMGHREIRTTQKYTHLNTAVQEGPHEALSAVLPGLRAAATRPARQAKGRMVKSMILPSAPAAKPQQKPTLVFPRPHARKQA